MRGAAADRGESHEARERQWIAAARAGDPEAFCRIVELYQDRIFTFLLRMVRQREEAEDLAQETFVRAWQYLSRYDSRWAFRTWLFTIARNLAVNVLRRPRAMIVSLDGGDDTLPPAALASFDASPAERATVREQKQRLAKALDHLSPQAAMAFTLFYQEQMSIAEIARAVGSTRGAVKVALHRARETLRTQLREPRELGQREQRGSAVEQRGRGEQR